MQYREATVLTYVIHTCTMLSVCDVTGSAKSPPGGDTAPTILTLPSRTGLPKQRTRPALS